MTSVELVNEYKSRCLVIVEKYSNIEDISQTFDEDEFFRDCCYITRAHFDDIIDERACSQLCGYVLCKNRQKLDSILKSQFKNNQVYHIKNNKVYDIKRRKCFCSELCFKKADFLKGQISTEPRYLRKEPLFPSNIKLYNDSLGQVGDEIKLKEEIVSHDVGNINRYDFDKKNIKNDDDKVLQNKISENIVMKNKTKKNLLRNEKLIENKISAPYVKEETFNELKTKFKGLQIKEKNINEKIILNKETGQFDVGNKIVNEEINYHNLTTNRDDKKNNISNFPSTFEPLNVGLSLESSQLLNLPKKSKFRMEQIIEDLLSKLSQWITPDTIAYLNVSKLENNDQLDNNDFIDLSEENEIQKLERFRQEYNRLCAKLVAEEIEDQKYDAIVLSAKKKENRSQGSNKSKKPSSRKTHKTNNSNPGKVNFKNDVEVKLINEDNTSIEESAVNESIKDENTIKIEKLDEPEPMPLFFPINEGTQSNIKRKQLFLKEMRLCFEQIFEDQLEISEMNEMLESVKLLINTFELNAENIAFGNNHHLLIGIFLLKILAIFGMIDERYVQAYNKNNFITNIIHKFYLTNKLLEDKLKQTIDNKICVKRCNFII